MKIYPDRLKYEYIIISSASFNLLEHSDADIGIHNSAFDGDLARKQFSLHAHFLIYIIKNTRLRNWFCSNLK